jgi:hypothetical protein
MTTRGTKRRAKTRVGWYFLQSEPTLTCLSGDQRTLKLEFDSLGLI